MPSRDKETHSIMPIDNITTSSARDNFSFITYPKPLQSTKKQQKTANYANILLIIVGFWNKSNHNGYMV
jgi:hypothetical protein